MTDSKSGFMVMRRRCKTCIYRRDTFFDLTRLEDEVRDPHIGFRDYRMCHHNRPGERACCHGFWTEHRDEFPAGQIAQRLGMVQFVEPPEEAS